MTLGTCSSPKLTMMIEAVMKRGSDVATVYCTYSKCNDNRIVTLEAGGSLSCHWEPTRSIPLPPRFSQVQKSRTQTVNTKFSPDQVIVNGNTSSFSV